MRKLFVTVTLLVMLAAVSCEIGIIGEKPEYTEDGQRLVTLKINTDGVVGNSRSLNNANARDDADFVEVIFKATTYYRATGYLGESLTIKLPKANYTVTDAVILIGKKNAGDYTLLAIGTLTSSFNLITGPTPPSIGFTVTSSLKADLTTGATNRAFEITDTSFWGGTVTDISRKGKYNQLPSFQVPVGISINASLTIDGFPTDPAINLTVAPEGVIFTPKLTAPGITASSVTPDATAATGSKKINITFPSGTGGDYIITFKIPVAFDTDTGNLGWFIRGGTRTGADFRGTKAEGIVLAVSADPYDDTDGILIGDISLP